jgi:hypothetical protein
MGMRTGMGMRSAAWGALLAALSTGCAPAAAPRAVPGVPDTRANPTRAATAVKPSRAAQHFADEVDPSQFLASVEVTTSDRLGPNELELLAPNYAGASLGELEARHLLLSRKPSGQLRIKREGGYVASTAAVVSGERRCSFVIDCDDLAVRGLVAELRATHPMIEANQVVRYVYDFIEHKHFARGFDIASVVAQKREGDCTEHAVLTAALLRAAGFPTHVVTGLVLVRLDGRLMAFGHAWTEYHDGQSWQLADATNAGQTPDQLAYIPLRVMKDEGPAYGRAAYDNFDVMDIESLVVPNHLEP